MVAFLCPPPFMKVSGGGGPDIISTFRDSEGNSNDTSVYTFSGMAFGAASADRYIVAAFAWGGGSGDITSVTIGGVSATILVQQRPGTYGCGLAIALVPSGTSGTVVLNLSAAGSRATCGVWSVLNLQSTTPVDTAAVSGDPAADTVSVLAGGCVIAASVGIPVSGTTWSGITERFDVKPESTMYGSGASGDFASANASLAISADFAGSPTQNNMCAVSLR